MLKDKLKFYSYQAPGKRFFGSKKKMTKIRIHYKAGDKDCTKLAKKCITRSRCRNSPPGAPPDKNMEKKGLDSPLTPFKRNDEPENMEIHHEWRSKGTQKIYMYNMYNMCIYIYMYIWFSLIKNVIPIKNDCDCIV
jgi:hypothetical protein